MNPKTLLEACMYTLSHNHKKIDMKVLPAELSDRLFEYLTCAHLSQPPCVRKKFIITTQDFLSVVVARNSTLKIGRSASSPCYKDIKHQNYYAINFELKLLHIDYGYNTQCYVELKKIMDDLASRDIFNSIARYLVAVPVENINPLLIQYCIEKKMSTPILELPLVYFYN